LWWLLVSWAWFFDIGSLGRADSLLHVHAACRLFGFEPPFCAITWQANPEWESLRLAAFVQPRTAWSSGATPGKFIIRVRVRLSKTSAKLSLFELATFAIMPAEPGFWVDRSNHST